MIGICRSAHAVCAFSLLIVAISPVMADDKIEKKLLDEIKQSGFPSLSVGVVRGDGLVYSKALRIADRAAKRDATPETLYRIGSISKVFTATLLAVLRDQEVVRLDDPVAKYLPADAKLPTDPRGAAAITLRHLATHSSGLPRQPINLKAKNGDPYGGYSPEQLIEGLKTTKLAFPTGADCIYSNLGVGLLGHALERAAKDSYDKLLQKHIFEPLGMKSSDVRLNDDLKRNFAVGYEEKDAEKVAVDWDLGALAPAGGIASNVPDLAKFLSLQLKAGQADVKPIRGGTLTELHTPQRILNDWRLGVGLGWHISHDAKLGDIVWHNGGMAGYHSYMAFVTEKNIGVIVLTNRGISVDELGRWLLGAAIATYAGKTEPKAGDDGKVDPAMKKIADELAKHLVPEPADALGELFTPEFKAEIPVDALKKVFAGIARRNGACRGVKTITMGRTAQEAEVLFQFDGEKTARALVTLNGGDPPLIAGLLFPPK